MKARTKLVDYPEPGAATYTVVLNLGSGAVVHMHRRPWRAVAGGRKPATP